MASITYWNRLEPRPVAPSIAASLSARVRDPLWFLTRQWQFGEFQGEDAGSPAFARVDATTIPLTGWRVGNGPVIDLPGGTPFEAVAEREAFTPDLSLRVELSQVFERILRASPGLSAAQAGAVLSELRQRMALPEPPADDPDARRLYLVCAGGAIDGVRLYHESRQSPPTLPPEVVLPADTESAVSAAQVAFAGWVHKTLGEIGTTDPETWQPQRLEYAVSLLARADERTALELVAGSSLDGTFDWHAFDLMGSRVSADGLDRRAEAQVQWSVIPSPVRFRGMPNARWWDFEHGATDFGDIRPDRKDLARLVVMDFMLVHGNDWFIIPYDVPVGALCRIDSLVVRDVFGGDTIVARADRAAATSAARWSLFSTTAEHVPGGLADFLLVPPTAAPFMQIGPTLEDVRFLRDELANLVWAVEETIEGGAGNPRPGHERSLSRAAQTTTPATGLIYRIQTEVPGHWIPFLPVTSDAATGAIVLERGGIPDPASAELIPPAGRILRPSALEGQRYQVFEEEVSRAGTRVVRAVCRSRWTDGSTHLWIARRKMAGLGEASSGLLFDGVQE